jgi:4'-phosphopantetheinyl transferase
MANALAMNDMNPLPDDVSWRDPAHTMYIGTTDVHVWRAELTDAVAEIPRLRALLTPDEKCRAERFHFQRDYTRFLTARGILRIILGRYLNREPEDLRFTYGRYGKPALNDMGTDALYFNLSHSDGLAIYAITRGRELGIDLEQIRSERAAKQIAERFFSPREVAALRALPQSMQAEAFFSCWTRKEAYIKATGRGLAVALDRFDVSVVPGERVVLLQTLDNWREASRWSLRALDPGPGFAAALAVEGYDWVLSCWQFSMPEKTAR